MTFWAHLRFFMQNLLGANFRIFGLLFIPTTLKQEHSHHLRRYSVDQGSLPKRNEKKFHLKERNSQGTYLPTYLMPNNNVYSSCQMDT